MYISYISLYIYIHMYNIHRSQDVPHFPQRRTRASPRPSWRRGERLARRRGVENYRAAWPRAEGRRGPEGGSGSNILGYCI
jgi:hypothetical protein